MHNQLLGVVISALIMSLMNAADQQLNALHIDMSPEGFMARLQQAERGRPEQEENRFNHIVNSDSHFELHHLANFMERKGLRVYFDYFYALATSKRIDERKKVDDAFVLIPYFQSLKDQEEKDAVLCDFCQTNVSYPLKRLFLAAFTAIGANVNKFYDGEFVRRSFHADSPFNVVIRKYHDVCLADKMLRFGADPNNHHPYFGTLFVQTLNYDDVLLLLNHGADIKKQHEINDLIVPFCSNSKIDIRIMRLYLQHISPREYDEFGFAWLKKLKAHAMYFDEQGLAERLNLLLEHAQYYDEQGLVPDGVSFGSFLSVEKQKEIFKVCLQQHPKRTKKKNIAQALHIQQRTGHSLRKQRVNLDAYYKQAIEQYEKQKEMERQNRVSSDAAALHHMQPWPVPEQGAGYVSGIYEADAWPVDHLG